MSLNAAAIRMMAEKGLTALDIAEIAEAMEVRGDRTAAERQQRHRDKVKAERDASRRDVTRDDLGDDTPSPNKSPPDPQKLTPTPVCAKRARARAAGEAGYHRLPEGWTPTRKLPPSTQAKANQWPPGAIEDELAALHRWAANANDEAGRGRKRDWDKAWVNWIERRHDEHFRRTGSGAGRAGPYRAGDGLSPTMRAALRVFGPCGDDYEGFAPP